MKGDADPMRPARRLQDAPRCTARSKRTGAPCKGPAVRRARVCRMHGAGGGGPEGKANGAWRHGGRSGEMTRTRALVALLGRLAREEADALLTTESSDSPR